LCTVFKQTGLVHIKCIVFVPANWLTAQAWVKELELMLETKQKAEIQSLSNFGFQYLTQDYLPKKIASGDWV
jgi:DNA topoisomerase VI subunit A